jgi:hypothetical protein
MPKEVKGGKEFRCESLELWSGRHIGQPGMAEDKVSGYWCGSEFIGQAIVSV